MKRKLMCFGVVLSIILSAVSFSVCAQTGEITAEIEYNYDTDSLEASGTIDTERAGALLALKVIDSSGNLITVSQTKSFFGANEEVRFSFPNIPFPIELQSGEVRVIISGYGVVTTEPYIVNYVGARSMLSTMQIISAATSTNFEDDVIVKGKELGMDDARYHALSPLGKSIFKTYMLRQTYELPSNADSLENKTKIKQETSRFLENSNCAFALADFSEIENKMEFDAWYLENFVRCDMDKVDANSEIDIVKAFTYLGQVKNTDDFISRIKSAPDFEEINDVRDYIYESSLLAFIKEMNYTEAEKVINDFSNLFGINTANMNLLSDFELSKCYASFGGERYDSISSAGKTLNDLVSAYIYGGNQQSFSPSGGSVVVSGKGSGTASLPSVTPDIPVIKSSSYKDMIYAEYAIDAVEYLTAHGIVSGKGDNKFAPNDNITRAEFIKMLVLATSGGTKSDVDSGFSDVVNSDWFAPYVSMAKKLGYVKGNENNKFLPYDKITRQDMVVMLYRALGEETKEKTKVAFEDWNEISDYAQEAVQYMYMKGYVKGISEGVFGASLKATRAQAAQILYNLMK